MTKQKFKLTDAQLIRLGEAAKPQKTLIISNVRLTTTPQERCNKVWEELGEELGFKWTTAESFDFDPRNFLAEPKEPKEE